MQRREDGMSPRRTRRAWRTLRARKKLVGSTVGMSFLMATSSALGQQQPEAIALPGLQVGAQRPKSYLPDNPNLFRIPEQYLDIPQSVTAITETLMREQAVFNLRDSLRNVTGISLQAGEGGGAQGDNLTLRGFNARTDIFLDGIRDTGQYNRDVFNLEAVEVLKGPSAVYFGRGSTGGVINQVSKTPQAARFYDFTASGSNGPMGRGTVDLNQPFGETMAVRMNMLAYYNEPVGRDFVNFLRWAWRRRSRGASAPTPSSPRATTTRRTTCPTAGYPSSPTRAGSASRRAWSPPTSRHASTRRTSMGSPSRTTRTSTSIAAPSPSTTGSTRTSPSIAFSATSTRTARRRSPRPASSPPASPPGRRFPPSWLPAIARVATRTNRSPPSRKRLSSPSRRGASSTSWSRASTSPTKPSTTPPSR